MPGAVTRVQRVIDIRQEIEPCATFQSFKAHRELAARVNHFAQLIPYHGIGSFWSASHDYLGLDPRNRSDLPSRVLLYQDLVTIPADPKKENDISKTIVRVDGVLVLANEPESVMRVKYLAVARFAGPGIAGDLLREARKGAGRMLFACKQEQLPFFQALLRGDYFTIENGADSNWRQITLGLVSSTKSEASEEDNDSTGICSSCDATTDRSRSSLGSPVSLLRKESPSRLSKAQSALDLSSQSEEQ